MILPAIDLMNGKAVQLVGGKEKKIELNNPLEIARKLSVFGELHVIDLDAALGTRNNQELIEKILKIAPCRVGGGIRSIKEAKQLVDWGAKKIIIGTKATQTFLTELGKVIPKDKIIVALDAKKGRVVTKGWKTEAKETPVERAEKLVPYCSEFLYTSVDNEGKMNGVDWKTIEQLKQATSNKLTIAGGISTVEEIKKIEEQGMNSVLGMALYVNNLDLARFVIPQLNWEKQKLIPTIVQDKASKEVLMLAYSTPESLQKTWETRNAWYWSRKRKKLWMKGETSGNIQTIKRVRYDCDKDTLLFEVVQTGVETCHKGSYSCFGEKETGIIFLNELYAIIENRLRKKSLESYTVKLVNKPKFLREKLTEEIREIIEADQKQDRENLIWELADIQYFLTVLAAKNKINLSHVAIELNKRNKIK